MKRTLFILTVLATVATSTFAVQATPKYITNNTIHVEQRCCNEGPNCCGPILGY